MSAPEHLTRSEKIFNGWTNTVSACLGIFSPSAALEFSRGRQALLSYKAATRKGPNARWRPSKESADNLISKDRDLTVARARDLARNSEYVSGTLKRICDNVIYKGIFPQAGCRKADKKLDTRKNTRLEKIYKKWAKEVKLSELQELVVRHLYQDGEILVHTHPDPELLEKGVVPLGIELIETDQLDRMVHGELEGGKYARHGIEYSSYGKPLAYHILPVHPGDGSFIRYSGESRRIPAGQIQHIFKRERASQSRGMPWLTPLIMTMHDFEDYQNSERIAARLMSSFVYFLKRTMGGNGGGTFPGAMQIGPDGQPIPGGTGVPKYTSPGQIVELPPGFEPEAQQYTRGGEAYTSFTKGTLKGAAVGAGVSYETFSNDFTDASYSSARSGTLLERRGYEVLQNFINERFNDPIWEKFISFLRMTGLFSGALDNEVPVTWQNPGWAWIDPLKDSRATELEIQLGITSRQEACAKQGKDFFEVADKLEQETERLKEIKLLEADDVALAA
ncbi:phage portal protein [Maridesulfovibrio sp.]|uniref:phage portal protein n=1 Tax=Maridesulfovibrio sp. TaxID=2795000 RepID=UPI0029CA31EE|nr:phage portal protein [Maridesulfovibrio sp.]